MTDSVKELVNKSLAVTDFGGAGGTSVALLTTSASETLVLKDLYISPEPLHNYALYGYDNTSFASFSPKYLIFQPFYTAYSNYYYTSLILTVNGAAVTTNISTESFFSGSEIVDNTSTIGLSLSSPIVVPPASYTNPYPATSLGLFWYGSSAAYELFFGALTLNPSTGAITPATDFPTASVIPSIAPVVTNLANFWFINNDLYYFFYDGNSTTNLYQQLSGPTNTGVELNPVVTYAIPMYDGSRYIYQLASATSIQRYDTTLYGSSTIFISGVALPTSSSFTMAAYSNGYIFNFPSNAYPTSVYIINATTGVCSGPVTVQSASPNGNQCLTVYYSTSTSQYYLIRRIASVLYIDILSSSFTFVSSTFFNLAGTAALYNNQLRVVNGFIYYSDGSANLRVYSLTGTLVSTYILPSNVYLGVLSDFYTLNCNVTTDPSPNFTSLVSSVRLTAVETV